MKNLNGFTLDQIIDMDTFLVGSIILCCILIALLLIIGAITNWWHKRLLRQVEETSSAYKYLWNLNAKYSSKGFPVSQEYTCTVRNQTQQAAETFEPVQFLKRQILTRKDMWLSIWEHAKANATVQAEYDLKATELRKQFRATEEQAHGICSLEKYQRLEDELCDKIMRHWVTRPTLHIVWEYTSPAGHNYYHDSYSITLVEALALYGDVDVLD